MWDRTVTISSAGKTFSVTGWKVRNLWIKNPVSNLQQSVVAHHVTDLCLLAWLVYRTWALDKAPSDCHAEHSVQLPNTFTGEFAQLLHMFIEMNSKKAKDNWILFLVWIFCSFLQEAVAQGLLRNFELMGQPECYFSSLAEELEGKRDRMAAILKDAGMTPIIPEGGYFMLVDVTPLSELLNI